MITLPPNLVYPNLRATGTRGARLGKHAADFAQLESFRQFFIVTSCVILSVYLNLISVKQKSRFITAASIIVDLSILAFLPLASVYPFLLVLSTIGMVSVGKAYTRNSNETLKINSSVAVAALFFSLVMTCFTNPTSPSAFSHQTVFNLVLSILIIALSTRRGLSCRALPILTSRVAVVGSMFFRLSLNSDIPCLLSGLLVLISSRRAAARLSYSRFSLEFAAGAFAAWFCDWDIGLVGVNVTEFSSWIRLALGLVIPILMLRMGSVAVSVPSTSPALTIVEVSNPGLRMRTLKTEDSRLEVPELKVESPVESASTTAPSAVVVVEGSCDTVVPDLNDDEDALFEKIASARI